MATGALRQGINLSCPIKLKLYGTSLCLVPHVRTILSENSDGVNLAILKIC